MSAQAAKSGLAQNIIAWILSVVVAAVFIMAGSAKLIGNPTRHRLAPEATNQSSDKLITQK